MEDCSNIFPYQFKDIQGRIIKINVYSDTDYKGLREMYDTFEPKGLEAGLPPANDKTRYEWIDKVVSSFFNIIVTHKGSIIGHAALETADKNGIQEYLIFLKQGYRHCCIGTHLSEIAKQVAKNMKCKKIWLSVRTGNAIAIRLFKKVGFNFVGKIDIQREMELKIKNMKKCSS
ncbi:MAG: GNAT family N-acetyltransferase [Desulfobacterales bacterium]|nr:GNAT family N-acetyltransferase [Desulfobacterales bacterium]